MRGSKPIKYSVSELFNAPDSDIVIQSSDGTLLKVHKKYLELATGAFPPAEMEALGKNVVLTESTAVLELLFQIIYPRRNPDLSSVSINILVALAEAAEKYEVYSAMDVCMLYMERALPAHITEVITYAAKYKYNAILDRAALLVLDWPPDSVVELLTQDMVVPWMRYYGKVCRVLFNATAQIETKSQLGDNRKPTKPTIDECSIWHTEISKRLLIKLGQGPGALLELDKIVSAECESSSWRDKCEKLGCSCKRRPLVWKNSVKREFDGIGGFSRYIL